MQFRLDPIFNYINRKSPVWISTPPAWAIGDCAEYMYHALLKARRDGKKVAILHRHELFGKLRIPVANRELFNIESDYLAVHFDSKWRNLGGWVLALVYGPWRALHLVYTRFLLILQPICHKWRLPYQALASIPMIGTTDLFNPDSIKRFSWDMVEKLEWQQQYNDYLSVRLPDVKRRHAEKIRAELGIPQSDWFVCLHVREGGFRNDWQVKPHRNASIQNYFKGIQLITASGGWVVRLGDSSMTPLPAMERVIDYAHTQFKSALMDIYLVSECRFFVGINSGPSDVARLFEKPIVFTNLNEWSLVYPLRKGDIAIIKHIFSRSRNRFLSLKEIVEESANCQSYPFPNRAEYEFVENSQDEIRDVIEEFLTRSEQYQYSEMQETFNSERSLQLHRWLDGETVTPQDRQLDVHAKYRVASRVDSVAGVVGHRYLEQNWLADSSNENMLSQLTV